MGGISGAWGWGATPVPAPFGRAPITVERSQRLAPQRFVLRAQDPARDRDAGLSVQFTGRIERLASEVEGLAMPVPLNIRTLLNSWFGENTYVVWRRGANEALVIDPGIDLGMDLEPLSELLRDEGLTVAAVLNTHGHGDHIGGNEALKQAYPSAPLVIGENEKHLLTDANANLSAMFGFPIVSPAADRTVREGDVLEFAGIRLEVLEVPGHSPGHVVFLHRSEPPLVFSGDVLFRGSIGRTDFPGSNGELMLTGIRNKIFALPDDTVVYPGHGPTTTTGHEKRTNPYVGEGAF